MDSSRRFLRPAAAIVLAVVWTLFFVMAAMFMGFSGEPLGWLWVALPLTVGLVLAALVWGAANQLIAIAVAVVLAFGIGALSWYASPPSPDRIVATAETVAIPDEWEQVSEAEHGNAWCWMGCPELVREYEVPDPTQAQADLQANLEADGWSADDSRDGRFTNGRWQVTIYEMTYADTPSLSVTFTG